MPFEFQETSLWKNAFTGKSGFEKEKAQKLESAFLDFREKVKTLAGEIRTNLPALTVHDISHLDALWDMASLIAGEDVILTPTEAFVLGGAFLTHDLAMSLAAYADGFKEIEQTPQWKDEIYKFLSKKIERKPTEKELADPDREIIDKARHELLRNLHAIQASKLATQKWTHEKLDYDQFLIDNVELRQDFGNLIGRLAESHWWSIEKVEQEFIGEIGAPGHFPPAWKINPLKLACLLRSADASHIDDRRAPTFLYVLLKPGGISDDHWKFQNHLNRPTLNNEKLSYSSKQPFRLDESSAWWLCFDTLTMIDGELRRVDALLAKKNQERFIVKGVHGLENADYLQKFVRVDGWEPVDTRIKVTDVAKLAETLGGKQLYGYNKLVPLRELIQNASDAVRARRKFENSSEEWGDIVVQLGEDENDRWIEVKDNGIGMSPEVLKGPFLDFGSSYWGSGLMMQEWPGLLSKGFEATGRFGIGFFSVFMWGSKIEVKTRKCTEGKAETFLLVFDNGLDSRPILKKANEHEQMNSGGTIIKLFLHDEVEIIKEISEWEADRYDEDEIDYEIDNINEREKDYSYLLNKLCMRLCPTLDVNLYTAFSKEDPRLAVGANDWLRISSQEIYDRLRAGRVANYYNRRQKPVDSLKHEIINKTLTSVYDDNGNIIGRLSLEHFPGAFCTTVGGFYVSSNDNYSGFLLGDPVTAERNTAKTKLSEQALKNWIHKQAEVFENLKDKEVELELRISSKLIGHSNDPGNLQFVNTFQGAKNKTTFLDWASNKNAILFTSFPKIPRNPSDWYFQKYISISDYNIALKKFLASNPYMTSKDYKEKKYEFLKNSMYEFPYEDVGLYHPTPHHSSLRELGIQTEYRKYTESLNESLFFSKFSEITYYAACLLSRIWSVSVNEIEEHSARKQGLLEIPFNYYEHIDHYFEEDDPYDIYDRDPETVDFLIIRKPGNIPSST